MTIFLIGYMASGKTTLGRALARELGFRFIDLDFYIEQRFRHRIPELFAHNGEAGFRDIEGRMLRESGEFCDTVVSCGGGTPCMATIWTICSPTESQYGLMQEWNASAAVLPQPRPGVRL